MNLRVKLLALAILAATFSGCSRGSGPGLLGGPGLFSNVNGARIAPPGTNQIRYPAQVATLPDPYYGQRPAGTTQAGNPNGWRPLGTNAATSNAGGASYNPTRLNVQTASQNTTPGNNVVVASTTSNIRPNNQFALNSQARTQPTVQLQPARPTSVQVPVNTVIPNNGSQVASNSVTGGMPLNDATRITNVQPQLGNRGILSRASEFVARPNTITRNGYNPNYNYGQVATASTSQQFNRPAVGSGNAGYRYPANGYQNGYPANGYQNGYPTNANVAQQWRQRDTR